MDTPIIRFPKRSAFTLIELLVAIAILGILAGLLYPVMGRASAGSRSAACIANLRQLGQATMMWSGENNNMIPPVQWDPDGGVGAYDRKMIWINAFSEYLGDSRPSDGYKGFSTVVHSPQHCPEGARELVRLPDYSRDTGEIWARMTYGITGERWDTSFPSRTLGISHPSRTVLYGDKVADVKSANYEALIHYPDNPWSDGRNDLAYRHNGKANIVFFDGHVESFAEGDDALEFNWGESTPENPWKPW